MADITYPIGTLVSGAKRIFDLLSDFEPDLERIEVNYSTGATLLFYSVTVPDKFFNRAKSKVTLDRPLDCTLEAIQNKNLLESYDIAKLSDTTYEIPADKLDRSEDYRLIISGRASKDILRNLIYRDCYTGKQTRQAYEQNLVYNPGAVTWDDSEVVTVISEYLDSIEFDENYLPRSVRKKLPKSVSKYQSTTWKEPYDSEEQNGSTSANIEDLPEEIQELFNAPSKERSWWFSAEVMGDYVRLEGPMNYYDLVTADGELPIPDTFEVLSRTEFGEKQGMMEGTVRFRKAEFWDELETELLQMQ